MTQNLWINPPQRTEVRSVRDYDVMSIITDFAGQEGLGITVEDIDNSGSKPLDSRQRLESGDLDIANNIWYGFAAGNGLADFAP